MRVTLLAPLASASMFVLATKARIALGPIGMILTAIAILAAIATLLPWDRVLRRRGGIALLAAWGLIALAIVSIGVWATGRAGSPLVLLYALTTVFFAVAFSPRGQIALFATTVVAYALALGADRGPLPIVVLGVLTFLAGFLVQQIRSQVRVATRAGAESERRWAVLATVSAAARDMTSSTADASDVLVTTTEAVHGLGFPAACVYVRGTEEWHIVPGGPIPDRAVPSTVIETARTGEVDRFGKTLDALPDFGVTVPIPTIDGVAGVLVVATGSAPGPEPQDVEVFRMLASQAGLALDTVRRFDDQRRVIERLAELDRMKNDFLSTVSHELRTPLTVISGMGRTLEHRWETLDDEIRSDFLARLNANATTLDQVISQLLDFSRLESGQLRPDAMEIDLSVVLQAVVDRLRTLLEGHDVELDVEPTLRTVADPGLIERVIENLLSNAAKYTPPGSHVTVSAYGGTGDDVIVAVADDGPGIPEDELGRIGERFFRGGDLNTRTTRGTGLGLAVVSEILELHGSRLEVESGLGLGSRFSFRLTKGSNGGLVTSVPIRDTVEPILVDLDRRDQAPALAGERFETVITAASLGVEWAIGLLYREFHPMLLRYLRARGATSPGEAADAVWSEVARGLPAFSGDEAAFRRWIFGSARALVVPGARFDASGSDGASSSALARVAGLPSAHADVLLLKALGNLDADDVALITGQEAGAVRLLEIDALRLLGDPVSLARMEEAS
jgi:signal transduction histidine kinase/DNA-directed RNA polymerase specialized sigma24 family protein